MATFLDASTHLYKRLCLSVGPSVGPSVRWLVRNHFFQRANLAERSMVIIPTLPQFLPLPLPLPPPHQYEGRGGEEEEEVDASLFVPNLFSFPFLFSRESATL